MRNSKTKKSVELDQKFFENKIILYLDLYRRIKHIKQI